jgi:hypothetical protein
VGRSLRAIAIEKEPHLTTELSFYFI